MRKCQCKCSSRKLERNKSFPAKKPLSPDGLLIVVITHLARHHVAKLGELDLVKQNILVGKKYFVSRSKMGTKQRKNVLCTCPEPSVSNSLIISRSSASVGFMPMLLMAYPSSRVEIVPPPSASNIEKVCLETRGFELEPPHERWRMKVHGKRQFYTICG